MKRQFDTDWADAACGPLTLRTAATAAEIQFLRDALQREHYLGAGRPAGHVLWQGVYELEEESQTEQLVAAFCWGGAALRLKDRDEWLGLDPVTRANRLNLFVQLRRFMVVTPIAPPSGPAQRLFQEPPAKSNFLGASQSPERRGWRS